MIDRMVKLSEPAHMVRLPKPADEPEIRFLGDVQKLSLESEDIVIISVPGHLSEDDRARIRADISMAIPDNKVIVLTDGMKIGVMGPA